MINLEAFKTLSNEMNGRPIDVEKVLIEVAALEQVPKYIKEKAFHHVMIVMDDNTEKVAGQRLAQLFLEAGIRMTCHKLSANSHGQVVADEETLIELILALKNETDVLIAVGSGTIHDIVRFVGAKTNKPFISVPTAASVDGFTSKGAPLIIKGVKQTIQTESPIAVFADIEILAKAPTEMTAAGFGDILGKYTSLVDWQISHLIADEPYVPKAAEMTRSALEACVSHVVEIAEKDEKGITLLMTALIESGLVMLVLDHSRPASGAEHHLSHFWEMALLKNHERQRLHGAKVGVATGIIIHLYKEKLQKVRHEHLRSVSSPYAEQLYKHWSKIACLIEELPDPEEIQALLKIIGGPTTPEELGLTESLVQESLREAHHLRKRCTGLFIINESDCNLSEKV
ncbi:glycerol-1-phosphate dehydrogenase [NAD(P)+] [Pullulanibacillus pueri]|uniref:Glycerol-1-phosphate dehydrogenase [NAD(P)+] n=1 Tax=Pullulanibacillus pueri TaxID=1437324 RepID=A0A8J2ZXW1_9BACL|nr:sn-glycerol-1-phosphate dehydrogenase [Pullulanibacillus pueri]MBM7683000.1 glycerol-1-phosphate dehydrogenase [NAD(P)+] [Pullulanibacillus pueri]GGH85907.1 glycerol-1-phosphate dehydrogenase [NAD(P)+] [Pullulanibacillus pueri]